MRDAGRYPGRGPGRISRGRHHWGGGRKVTRCHGANLSLALSDLSVSVCLTETLQFLSRRVGEQTIGEHRAEPGESVRQYGAVAFPSVN